MSGHALLFVSTFEKDRCIGEIIAQAKEQTVQRKVFIWSVSTGWSTTQGEKLDKTNDIPEMVIKSISEMPEDSIYILKEFWPYVSKETYSAFDLVTSWISEVREHLSSNGKTIIFLGSEFEIPNSLKHDITTLEFSLPDKDQIKKNILFATEGIQTKDKSKFQINEEFMDDTIRACQGMTSTEIVDRVSLAIRKHKTIDSEAIKTITREKASVIKASGILKYIEPPPGGLNNIGGYQVLKRTVLLDKPCFSEKAREFGIESPKGILEVGIPGCGKTELSKCIASELNQPLICLDIGSIMSGIVGSSESNMRLGLKIIESVCPCVLQLDEIEKGFGGATLDGGASTRVFGTLLKWLSERTCPVYVVATANDISGLPPEFFRSGRFDSVFFLDLPTESERKAIFNIHLKKRGRNPETFDIDKMVIMTKDYAGSDIEQIIKTGLKIAFSMNEEFSQDHLEMAVPSVNPLSKIEPTRINSIREWGLKHAKLANSETEKVVEKTKGRKVSV